MGDKENFGTMVDGLISRFGFGAAGETAEPSATSGEWEDRAHLGDIDMGMYLDAQMDMGQWGDDELRRQIDNILREDVAYRGMNSLVTLMAALKILDTKHRNALARITAVSEALEYHKASRLSLTGWAREIMRYKPNLASMTGRYIQDAPNVARVVKGLALLETVEKVEALRTSGIGIDISQMLIGEFDSIAPPYEWSVIIARTQRPYSIYERLVDTKVTADTQHAATLAAIAAYETEFGEVVV